MEWPRCAAELFAYRPDAPPRLAVLVCGPKGAGKSTFCRRLVAAADRPVMLLDADVARPDLTLPGIVSLHVQAPNAASVTAGSIFLGEDSPLRCPQAFLRAFGELVDLARQTDYVGMPLIVNTSGWTSGLGQDILEGMISLMEPSDVVQIVPERKLETLGSLLPASLSCTVWTLLPQVDHRPREAVDDVNARTVGLFAKAPTYCVGLDRIRVSLNEALVEARLPEDLLLLALSGSVVGLLRSGPEPRALRLAGLGLVHLTDANKRLLVLRVPAVSLAQLKQVNELVVSSAMLVPPSRFPHRPSSGERPFVSPRSLVLSGAEGVRTEAGTKRKRLENAAAVSNFAATTTTTTTSPL